MKNWAENDGERRKKKIQENKRWMTVTLIINERSIKWTYLLNKSLAAFNAACIANKFSDGAATPEIFKDYSSIS